MTDISIGGETYGVSLHNYKLLKRAWGHINGAVGNADFVVSADAVIGTIAVGLQVPLPGEPAAPVAGASPWDRDEALNARDEALNAIEAYRIDYIGERLTGHDVQGLKPFMNELLYAAGLAEKPGE